MRIPSWLHCVLSGGVAAALLAGCGGAQSTGSAIPVGQHSRAASKKTFKYTGAEQKFKVPAGVTQITITASGASGAPGFDYGYGGYEAPGGLGGQVRATVPVTPGESLAIFVGGSGSDGGFNGGGGTGISEVNFGYGGGASDVRQGGDRLADRVVVGSGGGGGGNAGSCITTSCGYSAGGPGGNGGRRRGKSGGDARNPSGGSGAGGGNQHAGGSGGIGAGGRCSGSNGKRGAGGAAGGEQTSCGGVGGGGGGGYYGGGGGGGGALYGQSPSEYAAAGGGAGGGSSFAEKSATDVRMYAGTHSGDGLIVVSW
ncbi:MAG TPA: hypothetical protein VGI19_17585 [Candidatus Cybelea sp.]